MKYKNILICCKCGSLATVFRYSKGFCLGCYNNLLSSKKLKKAVQNIQNKLKAKKK